jgi:hypothetical protein
MFINVGVGSDLEDWTPADYTESPAFLELITNTSYRFRATVYIQPNDLRTHLIYMLTLENGPRISMDYGYFWVNRLLLPLQRTPNAIPSFLLGTLYNIPCVLITLFEIFICEYNCT